MNRQCDFAPGLPGCAQLTAQLEVTETPDLCGVSVALQARVGPGLCLHISIDVFTGVLSA